MAEITKDVSREYERGVMVKVLVSWGLEWMPLHALRVQTMTQLGYTMSTDDLKFQLNYLSQGGYTETKTLRAGRADFELAVARATAKAVDLVEGRAVDPGVAL
jgi:hypothetical protein